jgi:hypothetical protein
MRVYSICRKCAEVHPADLDCPFCAIGTFPLRAPVPVIRARRPAPDQVGPSAFPSDGTPTRRRVMRASALVVSAYVFAVVVLLLAVFAQA